MSQLDLFGEGPVAKPAPRRADPPRVQEPKAVAKPAPQTGRGLPPRDDHFSPGHRVTCQLHGAGRVNELYPSGLLQVQFGSRHFLYHRDGVLEGRWPLNEDMTLDHA